MKTDQLFFLCCLLFGLAPTTVAAQSYTWEVVNVGSYPGERVVALLDAGTVGAYTGIAIEGTVVDDNSNWGNKLPAVAHFNAYVRFSGGVSCQMEQDVRLNNIILRIRKISSTQVRLTALCPNTHQSLSVHFNKVTGTASVTMSGPGTIDDSGDLLVSEPVYRSRLSEELTLGNNAHPGKLEINGNIRAKEIKVETANWPDYVFDADYKVRPLAEVECYVREHKHLPEIPSAKEIGEKGLDLAEMNLLLLKKVEELTLHLVAQSKELSVLKGQVNALQAEKNK